MKLLITSTVCIDVKGHEQKDVSDYVGKHGSRKVIHSDGQDSGPSVFSTQNVLGDRQASHRNFS